MKNIENKYTKKEIISKLCEAAKIYEKNLLNKNIMFVFETKNSISYIETIFNDYNFQHLTGIAYTGTAKKFLKNCINGILPLNDINITKERNIFMKLKLDVLISAMSINQVAKRIGDYNYSKENITIEKVIGNIRLAIGFSKLDKKGKELKYYYPKTLLKDKINYNTKSPSKIVAILSKNRIEKYYKEITYLGNNTNLSDLFNVNEISKKIDYEKIYSNNQTYQKKIKQFFNENST